MKLVSPSCKSTHTRPARSAASVTRRVSTRTSVYGLTFVFTVGLCWTATITLPSAFVTEGSDGAYVNLYPRVRSWVLLREAPVFLRGESSPHTVVIVPSAFTLILTVASGVGAGPCVTAALL